MKTLDWQPDSKQLAVQTRTILGIKRIVVPLDFSAPANKALRYAAALAQEFGAALTLVHVIEPAAYASDFGPVALQIGDKQTEKQLRKKLADLATAQVNQTVPVFPHVETGKPWRKIVALARTHEADLIVIATRGYTGVKHVLLGSTAEQVLRHAPCPVLVVRETEHEFVAG